MIQRAIRIAFRLAGWLLIPFVAVLAAFLGATLAALAAPRFSPATALIVTLAGGLIGAGVGFWLWLRIIRGSPELQEALAVTPDGVPTEGAIEEMIGPESADLTRNKRSPEPPDHEPGAAE